MKSKWLIIILSLLIIFAPLLMNAQCAMCTKTASQLGEKPALGLNKAIIYLMLTPFVIMGVIAYRWWKANKSSH